MKSSLFWDVTQRSLTVSHRFFWTTYWYHFRGLSQFNSSVHG